MSTTPKQTSELMYPLNVFYFEQGRDVPRLEVVDGSQVPEPYRRLLVHDRDMTPTLEAYYGSPLHLHRIRHEQSDGVCLREVLLLTEGGRKAEFGAIRIRLGALPAEARLLVLEGRVPLGSILHRCGVAHRSRPSAFFRVAADDLMSENLGVAVGQVLYGRRNELSTTEGELIAQVIELLPPELTDDHEPDA